MLGVKTATYGGQKTAAFEVCFTRYCVRLEFEVDDDYFIDIGYESCLATPRRHRAIIGRSCDVWGYQFSVVILSVLIDCCLISSSLTYLSVTSSFIR